MNRPKATIFWYLNSAYLGKTTQFHEIPVLIDSGNYNIIVVDELGNEIS